MAKNKGKRDDVITISGEDWKGKGDFKTAPGGKYRFKFNTKASKIVPNAKGDGNNLLLVCTLTAMHNGKKTEHKGVNVFDRIAPHVGWKIAQILRAMGMKKPPKKPMTLKQLLELIKKYNKEIRVVIGKKLYNGKPQNPVLQYLPLDAGKDEEDDDIEDDDDADEDDDEDDDDDNGDDDSSDEDDDDDDSDDSDDDDDDEDEDEDDEEDDDDDDDDDEDDEEDEKPRKGAKKGKGKKGKKK